MAKLIVILEDSASQVIPLAKGKFTIGRARHNDLVINYAEVSAEHVTIVTIGNDIILQDLGSTNGTKVNGQPIKRHYLQNNDVIKVGQCAITYHLDSSILRVQSTASLGQSEALSSESRNVQTPLLTGMAIKTRFRGSATVNILNGAYQGQVLALTDWLTTIGQQGKYIALITRNDGCYVIGLMEGIANVLINNQFIGTQWLPLNIGDIIEVEGTKMRFEI